MRSSAFRGTWAPNSRPYISIAPDMYISLQGETTLTTCGECRREVNFNKYVTQVSTEASVDSPPGSATFTLSVPDNDRSDLFVDDQLTIMSMMEVEIFGKGYFTVGGIPQYYKIFWGMIQTVTHSWSNGVTTIQVTCKDILRWWELTNVVLNPAFLTSFGTSAGNFQMFGNQFASMNPYTVIVQLAKEAMGDFSLTQGSFTSFIPESGPENAAIDSFAKNIMTYWQAKFSNIWNSLVMYGSSGRSYTVSGEGGTVSGSKITETIIKQEEEINRKEGLAAGASSDVNDSAFKVHTGQLAAFKTELSRAADVDFFQTESQSKLAVALTARDQAGYEFYCDTTGDIVFKPPFYNLNVIPNKPVSWIQDFEIIDDSITESETEVYTHITSSGNAFSGGSMDYGLNDEITTPRTGVFDFHLLRRYGWRRLDYQCEWASNPRQLFFHLIDYLDRVNSKRQNGSVTIPHRPELRMGFPIWIPRYDSFFYIQGLSHQHSVGGQSTTTLSLTAKRSKFIAPNNIGKISQKSRPASSGVQTDPGTGVKAQATKKSSTSPSQQHNQITYEVSFPSAPGDNSGISQSENQAGPQLIRDPKTGKLLGFPNVVMVLQKPFDGDLLTKLNTKLQESPDAAAKRKAAEREAAAKQQGNAKAAAPARPKSGYNYENAVASVYKATAGQQKGELIKRLRAHRYESGMTNAGAYDYAHDIGNQFKELTLVPVDSVVWASGSTDPSQVVGGGAGFAQIQKDLAATYKPKVDAQELVVNAARNDLKSAATDLKKAKDAFAVGVKNSKGRVDTTTGEIAPLKAALDSAQAKYDSVAKTVKTEELLLNQYKSASIAPKKTARLNMMIRPVSDEFGFELIGHYRYGRGAFIDRGKIQVADVDGSTANKLNIQFASTGGLLTDGPGVNRSGPQSVSFAQAFEDMRPEDYVTGATFDHGVTGNGDVQNVAMIGQKSYDNAILSSRARTGNVIFADVDATRRGVTLAELKPTLGTGLSAGFEKCSCQLGKTDWLSVLPQSALDQILRPSSVVDRTGSGVEDGTILSSSSTPTDGTSNKILTDFGSFFDIVNAYLVERFGGENGTLGDYADNALREQDDIGASIGATRDDGSLNESSNLLGDPQSPLFAAASNGNVEAIEALQKAANFNFGMTEDAANAFPKRAQEALQRSEASLAALPGQFALAVSNPVVSVDTRTPVEQAREDARRTLEQAELAVVQAEQYLRENPNSDFARQNLADAQANYQKAASEYARLSNASDKSNAVNAATVSLAGATSKMNEIQLALSSKPGDPELTQQLAKAQAAVVSAQAVLRSAQADTLNTSVAEFQPPTLSPTRGGVLDPSKFGVDYGNYRDGNPFPPFQLSSSDCQHDFIVAVFKIMHVREDLVRPPS